MKNQFQLLFISVFILFCEIAGQTGTLESTFSIKTIDSKSVPYQNGIVFPSFEKQNRSYLDLSGIWLKERVEANDDYSLARRDSVGLANILSEGEGRHLADYDDSGWEEKLLPAVENEMNEYPTVPEFFKDGVWYRRNFSIDEADSSNFIKLVFLSVNYIADVWINGEYIGYHEGGYTPFAFDISDKLIFGGENSIAVRVDLISWNTRNDIVPYKQSDWFNYGGIIHDVYLEFSNKVSVARADVVPLNLDGDLETKVVIQNKTDNDVEINVETRIYEAFIESYNLESEFAHELIGDEVYYSAGSQNSITINADSIFVWAPEIKIDNPNIWSTENPNLYIIKIALFKNEEIIDEFYSQFGIRTLKTEGNKFLINDRVKFLTGIARHEDHPVYGRSLPKEIIKSDLDIIQDLNVNFIRTAHYPNHPYTYLLLDRLGITAMEEIPVYWFDEAEPWQIQNNDRKIHLQMFREMVFKDFNRPSIIMWSGSNECHEETNRLIYNQMLAEDRVNYFDGRMLSQSPAADNPGASDVTQEPMDIAGWTMYFGIFHGSTYFGGTYNFINQIVANFPDKPILDTEFGYWSSENNSTEQEQVTVIDETFKAFKLHASTLIDGNINENGALIGCTYWCAFDWYTAGLPRGYQSMGLYSMDRETVKPSASKLKVLYFPYFKQEGILLDVETPNIEKKNEFRLNQNYPNPFNPATNINFSIPEKSNVTIEVFDINGEKISELFKGTLTSGNHSIEFLNKNLSSGVYFYKLKTEKFVDVKKMILLK